MSLVSSRLSLTHRVTVQRAASADLDGWGNPNPPGWQDHLTDLPCRVWTAAGREAVDATTTVVVEDVRLLVALDTDVTEADRLSDVTFRGASILTGPTSIRAVLHNADHLELVLTRIS